MARIDLRQVTLHAMMLASPNLATALLATDASVSSQFMHGPWLTRDEFNRRLGASQLPLFFTEHLDM